MRWIRWAGAFGSVVVLLGGCAANDMMVKRQTEIETKVEHLFQVAGAAEARMNDLALRMASIEENEPSRTASIKELQEAIKELKDFSRGVQVRFGENPVAVTPKVEVVNPESSFRGKETGPPASYVKAFGLYSSNNFGVAIIAFEQFLKESPGSEYAPNANYWIGECYYSTNDLNKGLISFQKVVDNWPHHSKAPDSLLKIGYSYSSLKQPEKAKAAFERIIRSYPGSPATTKARERLMSRENPAS